MKTLHTLILLLFAGLFANAQEPFITTWEVSGDNLEIEVPIIASSGTNYTIDFGDGNVVSSQSSYLLHTYSDPGTYTVSVSGNFNRIDFTYAYYPEKLMTIEQWGDTQWTTMQSAFKGCTNLTLNATDIPDLSQATSLESMFQSASSFNQSIDNWDVSTITNLNWMFLNAISFNQPLNNWDTSSVSTTKGMFYQASAFNQPLNNWDVSNVTDMEGMFCVAVSFNQPLDNWDVSNVKMMGDMFAYDPLFNQPLNNWNTSNVENAGGMFRYASSFNQPLNNWVSIIWGRANMFDYASSFNQDLSAWNFGNTISLPGLDYCGMDSHNYDLLLQKFVSMGPQDYYMAVNASGLTYCDSEVHDYLVNELQWYVTDDGLSENCSVNTISGYVRYDGNANGCDASDISTNNLLIQAHNGIFTYSSFSSTENQYTINVFENTYEVSLYNIPDYFTATPATSTVSFEGFGNIDVVNFCLTANETINDLNITILPLTEARPGFEATYQLVASNIGTQTVNNVALNLAFDTAAQTFVSATETADTATAGQLGFTVASLQPFETKTIDVVMQTFTPPTVNGDDILNFMATITPDTTDSTPNDNAFNFAQTVVNSYDPNDKQVVQGAEINITQAGEYLDYIIRFQNTGTASAIKVRIEDELSDMLDWTTLTPISASHGYRVAITDGSHVEYIFDYINLPAQQDDDAGSNGYIAYKIKPIQDVAVGDIITGNAASIYFDYNLPIITNAVATEIISTTGTENFTKPSVKIYPNPVNDVLSIDSKENITDVTIYSLQGNKLLSFSNITDSISLKSLNAGMYLLVIDTGRNKITHKVIKN